MATIATLILEADGNLGATLTTPSITASIVGPPKPMPVPQRGEAPARPSPPSP